MQVKFFEFINKAQIQAAKRISSAMNSDTAASGIDSLESSGNSKSIGSREDFFHVIQAAKEAGIQESDFCNIWSEQQHA